MPTKRFLGKIEGGAVSRLAQLLSRLLCLSYVVRAPRRDALEGCLEPHLSMRDAKERGDEKHNGKTKRL